jgi:hypothetical protein
VVGQVATWSWNADRFRADRVPDIGREGGTVLPREALTGMPNNFLALIVSCVLLLVTAFALASPRVTPGGQPDKAILLSALRK